MKENVRAAQVLKFRDRYVVASTGVDPRRGLPTFVPPFSRMTPETTPLELAPLLIEAYDESWREWPVSPDRAIARSTARATCGAAA